MNDSPNYHSLNTCARGLKSPGRLSLLTIFIRISVSALGGISLWPGGCPPPQVLQQCLCMCAKARDPECVSPQDVPRAICPLRVLFCHADVFI